MPSFIRRRTARSARPGSSSIRMARPDGGVHGLFVISGRVDGTGNASGCTAVQEDFERQVTNEQHHLPDPHAHFRCRADRADLRHDHPQQPGRQLAQPSSSLGISGRPNSSAEISGDEQQRQRRDDHRFGWKAQNKSLLIFSGEAYNVEMGITNEVFQQRARREPHLPVRHGAQRRDRPTPPPGSAPSSSSPASCGSSTSPLRRPATRPVPSARVAAGRSAMGKQVFTQHRLRAVSHAEP